jgi:hypothetical protein
MTYLARLKEKIGKTPLPGAPSKPSKPPFEGFEGGGSKGVCSNLRTTQASAPTVHEAEREAIAIELGGLPEAYAKAFAAIQAHPPADVPRHRWDMFVNDAGLFLDAWGLQAARLGWTVADLLGLDALKPMERYDRQGLLWMLHGERVVALTSGEARFSGGLAYYRRQ